VEETIRDLIKLRSSNLVSVDYDANLSGFNFIGVVDNFSDLEKLNDTPIHIWHIHDGITTLNKFEIERWSVDAPPGSHLLLSEREFDTNLSEYRINGLEIILWNPERLALWLGKTILLNNLNITFKKSNSSDKNNLNHSKKVISTDSPLTLRPQVDLDLWLSEKSWSGISTTPVLLLAKLWFIEGELVNSEGCIEKREWNVLEDPWSSKLSIFLSSSSLDYSPSLKVINPISSNWKNEHELLKEVSPLISEKRQGKPKLSGEITRSMILEHWKFNENNASIKWRNIMIPSWIINVNQKIILHGITGKTHKVKN